MDPSRGSQKRKTNDDMKRSPDELKTARIEKADKAEEGTSRDSLLQIEDKPDESTSKQQEFSFALPAVVLREFPDSAKKDQAGCKFKEPLLQPAGSSKTSDARLLPETRESVAGEYTEDFFRQVPLEALESVCKAAERMDTTENLSDDEPLSPIVGYTFSSDDQIESSDSEPNAETIEYVKAVNDRLAKMTGRELSPEPNTPRTLERRKMRKKRIRRLRRSLEPTVASEVREKSPTVLPEQVSIKTKEIDGSSTSEDVHVPSAPYAASFTTASGKPVSVSSEALKKAQGLFTDIDSYESKNKHVASLMSKVAEKPSTVFPKLVSIKAMEIDGSSTSEDVHVPNAPYSASFTTASGKPVSVSSEALKKAQGLFTDIDSYESKNKYIASRMSKVTETSSTVLPKLVNMKAMEIDASSTSEDMHVPSAPYAASFTTASGKPVSVSKEALKKAQGLFTDIDSYESKNKLIASRMPKSNIYSNLPSGNKSEGKENVSAGEMTQEVLDCIQAFLADEEESSECF